MSPTASDSRLHAVEAGGEAASRETPALVFLHGFDGSADAWADIQPAFASPTRRTLAFDLPGHGGSLDYPGFGPPKVAARAVLAELDRRGIEAVHLVGHSMGGAVACLAALFALDRVASLTLLAPGGFGPEIGASEIGAAMDAETPESLTAAVAAMGAPGWTPASGTIAAIVARRTPAHRAAIRHVFALLFAAEGKAGTQGVLPLDAVAATGRPVRLVWGAHDPVTPFAQTKNAPASFDILAVPQAGHMLMLEAPEACRAAIAASLSQPG